MQTAKNADLARGSRPRYDSAARTRRKCPRCCATGFRAKRETSDGIDFALLICDNAECGVVVAGGPVPTCRC